MAARVARRGTPDSAARLKALTRRAYTATAGHLDLDDDAGREFDRIVRGEEQDDPEPGPRAGHRALPARRWAVSGRAALVVLAVAAALAGALVARAIALGPSDAMPVPQLTAPVRESAETGGVASSTPAPGTHTGAAPAAPATAPATVVVHVAGAVGEPGIVELPAGARVAEAVDAAGGAQPDAELAAVNLARPVQDGEQVYVPRVGEVPPGTAAGPGGGTETSGSSGDEPTDGGVVDLNTADLAALDTLPGVGPAIAGRILDWREANGPFHSVDELLEVSGIGPATLDRLRERVRV